MYASRTALSILRKSILSFLAGSNCYHEFCWLCFAHVVAERDRRHKVDCLHYRPPSPTHTRQRSPSPVSSLSLTSLCVQSPFFLSLLNGVMLTLSRCLGTARALGRATGAIIEEVADVVHERRFGGLPSVTEAEARRTGSYIRR